LIQALNDYSGAVILISHDRHMVELTADRLVLVDAGTAREYAGSMEDYIDFVLGRNQPKKAAKKAAKPAASKAQPQAAASSKDKAKARFIKSELEKAEKSLARLTAELAKIDVAVIELGQTGRPDVGEKMADLLASRAQVSEKLARAEAEWLAAGERLEEISPTAAV